MIYESFFIKGRLAYQATREEDGFKRRAVHQPDGNWRMYSFYPGRRSGVGVPLRGVARQAEILETAGGKIGRCRSLRQPDFAKSLSIMAIP